MKLPTAGLISLKGKPRAVLDKLLAMRKRLSKPLGPLNLPKRKDATKENE
jgi:hypothetical protein